MLFQEDQGDGSSKQTNNRNSYSGYSFNIKIRNRSY